ncbi:MAG: hypothetical protein H5U30_02725 [Marinobacter sp.]|nr:hypothetical protein [Marinobacter sp.]
MLITTRCRRNERDMTDSQIPLYEATKPRLAQGAGEGTPVAGEVEHWQFRHKASVAPQWKFTAKNPGR